MCSAQRGSTRVLVTEDDALIGFDLSDLLESAGYQVIGPAATIVQSLRLLEAGGPHLAVIDYVLRDGICTELAHALRRRGVPFIIQSGLSDDVGIRAAFGAVPWLTKPVAPDEILDMLSDLGTDDA